MKCDFIGIQFHCHWQFPGCLETQGYRCNWYVRCNNTKGALKMSSVEVSFTCEMWCYRYSISLSLTISCVLGDSRMQVCMVGVTMLGLPCIMYGICEWFCRFKDTRVYACICLLQCWVWITLVFQEGGVLQYRHDFLNLTLFHITNIRQWLYMLLLLVNCASFHKSKFKFENVA